MYDKVIFFANDFGYGPTSNALSIARALMRQGVPVVLVTANQNDSILQSSGVPIEHISNLRDVSVIKEYILSHTNNSSLIVSVMNRFAITAANATKRKSVLVENLFWFWRDGGRPAEYVNADIQIRCVLPWQIRYKESTYAVRYACVQADTAAKKYEDRAGIELFSFNGLRTPFYTEKHDIYVSFMGHVIRELTSQQPFVIAGPEYIRPLIEPFLSPGTAYTPLTKAEYLDTLISAKRVYLNGGQNSFLEAIEANTQPVMTLPSNQSQYGLMSEVAKEIGVTITDICPLLNLIPDHERMLSFTSEREALDAWADTLHDVLSTNSAAGDIAKYVRNHFVPEVNISDHFPEWRSAMEQSPSIDTLLLDIIQA